MPTEIPNTRQEMIALLGRMVGNGPLADDLRRTAIEAFAALVRDSSSSAKAGVAALGNLADTNVAATAVGNRKLVYVHGICRHIAHFSDPWWDALHPFVPTAFGPGTLGQTRL